MIEHSNLLNLNSSTAPPNEFIISRWVINKKAYNEWRKQNTFENDAD